VASGESRAKERAVVRIGTWNLENLFRPGGDSGPEDQDAYDAKLDSLTKVIVDLEPDVLAVQEVGDPEAIDDLVDRLSGGWHTALADPDGRGIRVGLLSRLALADLDQVTEFPDRLAPVQVDDAGTTIGALGRPALRGRIEAGSGASRLCRFT
jgi:endonuclease/exonuclease/phosphatase family protein